MSLLAIPAKVFIGTAMEVLSNTLGINQTNTLSHNSKSNVKMERVWEFVGHTLKAMTTEQYVQFYLHLPFLDHVWNTTPDSDTNVTPFEAEHDIPIHTVAQSLTENPPPEGLPADSNDLTTIERSHETYLKLLVNVKTVEKVIVTRNLNERGFTKITYQVGDRVTFFLSPSQN